MFSPEPVVVGDQPTVAEHPHPVQVSDHLDAPPDHRRVHRVVVGIQPHVMITRQPRRMTPTQASLEPPWGVEPQTYALREDRRPSTVVTVG